MSMTGESIATAIDSGPAVAERVLIVEDDSAARVGLEQLVKAWGFIAESAADGEEALEKVTSFRPAIVITDMVMPRMDGLALLRALRSEEHTSELQSRRDLVCRLLLEKKKKKT